MSDRVTFEHCDVMELSCDTESFDAAWALESLCHVADRRTALANIARVLRPGGRLVLTDFYERAPVAPDRQHAVDRYYRDFMMGPMVGPDGYPRLLREAGLLFGEQTDISDETMRRTFTLLSARIGSGKSRLEDRFGDEMVEQFDPADMVDVWELGYLVVVGQRPSPTAPADPTRALAGRSSPPADPADSVAVVF